MKILTCKPVTTKAGNPKVLIQTATKDIWLSIKQWQSKNCSAGFDNYVGGDIEVSYYKIGELLRDGKTACTKDDSLVNDFIISANPVVLANAFALEATNRLNDLSDKSALFARTRDNATKTVDVETQLAD